MPTVRGPLDLATSLRVTNAALIACLAALAVNTVAFCSQNGGCKRGLPLRSWVGACKTREIANFENTLLVILCSLAALSYVQRFAVGACSYTQLTLAMTLPFLASVTMSFDTKSHVRLHALLGYLVFFLAGALIFNNAPLLLVLPLALALLLSPRARSKMKKAEDQAPSVFTLRSLAALLQSTLVLLFVAALVRGNARVAQDFGACESVCRV